MSRYRTAVVGILAVAVTLSAVMTSTPAYAEDEIASDVAGAESEAPVEEVVTEAPVPIATDPVVVPPVDTVVVEDSVIDVPDIAPPVDELPVADPTAPGAPANASATAGSGSAVVRWNRPTTNGGATIRSFVVRAEPSGQVVQVPGDTTVAKMTGLQNGEPATFKVTARNVIGAGAASKATDAVTPRAVAAFVVEGQPRRRVVYGTRSAVRVALVTTGGVGVPNQRVNLLARVSRSSRWRQVDSDTLAGQLLADPARSGAVLAQCEAMGEHSPAADRALGEVDETSQTGPARAGEPHTFGHITHPPRQESNVFASRAMTGVDSSKPMSSCSARGRIPSTETTNAQ